MFSFSGEVVKGANRGVKLGFPTININAKIDLPYGVYACRVYTKSGKFKGALHHGPRPSFNDEIVTAEVHIIGFEGNLYDEKVKVDVYNKIREIMKIGDIDGLKKQIADDVQIIKNMNF